jgi:hypothetical protein
MTLMFAFISNGVALKKPLAMLVGFYDLHLFPENDHFDYRVSEVHRASQILHVISFCMMGLALVLMLGSLLFFSKDRWETSVDKELDVVAVATSGLAAATYLAGIFCLVKIAIDYKHLADDLPIPTPDWKLGVGSIMDILGVISSLFAFILAMLAISGKGGDSGRVRLL